MSAKKIKSVEVTYFGWKIAPAVGFFAPFPFLRHLRPGYGLDVPPDLSIIQLDGADPGRVQRATHVADLVDSALEGQDPAADECCKQVIGRHPLAFELHDDLVYVVDLLYLVRRVIPPVELCGWGTDDERWQVD